MWKIAVGVSCALVVAGCDSNDCIATEVGSCQSKSENTNPPVVPGLAAFGLKASGSTSPSTAALQRAGVRQHRLPLLALVQRRRQPVDCTMKLADRYGLIVGEATKVQFNSEAGAVSPLAVSPAFDPAVPVSGQKDIGHAVGFLEVFGAPLPADQPPLPGERFVQVDFGCGSRIANPRDGLVTVIAYVPGEEGFADVNRNGQYDAGEPFVDLGEPFVDANDSGEWDTTEWFADVNGNGKWDAPQRRLGRRHGHLDRDPGALHREPVVRRGSDGRTVLQLPEVGASPHHGHRR